MKNRTTSLSAVVAASLLLSGCYDTEKVATIPDAENILFLSNGALVVSGGENLYQITEVDGERTVNALLPSGTKCNFTGIAEDQGWVFSTCVETKFLIFKNNHLWAAKVPDNASERLQIALVNQAFDLSDPIDKLFIPNGLAFAPDGALLVANYNPLSDSGVARFELSYPGPNDIDSKPAIRSFDKSWLDQNQGINNPNGVRVNNNQLFVSNDNKVMRFDLTANGQATNATTVVNWTTGIIDDIMPFCGGVAVTDYVGGRLMYYGRHVDTQGNESFELDYATVPFAFSFPSSLAVGQPPLYSGSELLITEKGILQEKSSSIGNQLTSARLSLDLNDPYICSTIESLR